jgi:hypothetical protein
MAEIKEILNKERGEYRKTGGEWTNMDKYGRIWTMAKLNTLTLIALI